MFDILKHSLDAIVAGCNFLGKRSRARGVEHIKYTIPMLGGNHFFVIPMFMGTPILMFWTPLRRECLKIRFSEKYQMVSLTFSSFATHPRAVPQHCFWLVAKTCFPPSVALAFSFHLSIDRLSTAALVCVHFENAVPTLRGVHFFKFTCPWRIVCCSTCCSCVWELCFSPCVSFTFCMWFAIACNSSKAWQVLM